MTVALARLFAPWRSPVQVSRLRPWFMRAAEVENVLGDAIKARERVGLQPRR